MKEEKVADKLLNWISENRNPGRIWQNFVNFFRKSNMAGDELYWSRSFLKHIFVEEMRVAEKVVLATAFRNSDCEVVPESIALNGLFMRKENKKVFYRNRRF